MDVLPKEVTHVVVMGLFLKSTRRSLDTSSRTSALFMIRITYMTAKRQIRFPSIPIAIYTSYSLPDDPG